jgi:hypothetical protein
MKIKLSVREVFRDDPKQYAELPDGSTKFMGTPLRRFITQIQENDGLVEILVAPGPLESLGKTAKATSDELDLSSELVHPTVRAEVVSSDMVRIDLSHWKDRDPDNTFLSVGWRYEMNDEELRAAKQAGL